ncbi:MAG TPA: YqaA family protein [Stellaceae bacterium]|nr:YqaA family protein [Stellaceae bacterium]
MLRRLYDWVLRQASGRYAVWVLAGVSFAESSFFPLPPDLLLIPMMVADRRRVWWLAFVCTAASVCGGFLGYAIGYYLFQSIGMPILTFYGVVDRFLALKEAFNQYGVEIIVLKGMTPIPYKLITIASGVAGFDLVKFALASVVSRSIRFFLLAVLIFFFGEPVRRFIEQRLMLVTTVSAAALVGGFLLVKLL